jgi:hypothetical protein
LSEQQSLGAPTAGTDLGVQQMATGDIKTFDIVYSGLTLKVNAVDMGGGVTKFFITCLNGYADLNALYWGDDVADSSNFDLGDKKDNSLNMNGSGADFDGGMKLSSTGLGPAGTAKSTYITAGETLSFTGNVNWDDVDTFGVRATSTSTSGGSIKGVDNSGGVTTAPHITIDDITVTEGVDPNATFTITLDHAYLYDITLNYSTSDVDAAAGSDYTTTGGTITILAGQTSVTVSVPILNDDIPEATETFHVNLSGATADLPGPDLVLPPANTEAFGVGTILDIDEEIIDPPPGGGGEDPTPPPTATAGSHGFWSNHAFTDSEGFAANVGATSFDDYFNIDSPTPHTWTDQTGGGPGATTLTLDDLSFARAVAFANGSGASGDTMTPNPGGSYEDLVREAAISVLNFYDADHSQSFVDWYIYERTIHDNDADAGNNPYDSASVLADLRAQVEATIEGASGAYSVADLGTILHATHE